MERKSPMPGEIYRHFKNKLYQIVGVAIHSESKEKLVIYQALYGDYGIYARPYDMFMSEVDYEKYPDAPQKYRFEKIERIDGQSKESDSGSDIYSDDNNINKENASGNIGNVAYSQSQEIQEEKPNEDLMAFLDAETYEEKKAILVSIRPRITDRLINDMAAAIDVTVEDGDIEARFRSLLYCVSKLDEFEVTRLRK